MASGNGGVLIYAQAALRPTIVVTAGQIGVTRPPPAPEEDHLILPLDVVKVMVAPVRVMRGTVMQLPQRVNHLSLTDRASSAQGGKVHRDKMWRG